LYYNHSHNILRKIPSPSHTSVMLLVTFTINIDHGWGGCRGWHIIIYYFYQVLWPWLSEFLS